MNDSPNPNPFENQLQDDIAARRAAPTANTIRIGDAAAPPPVNSSPTPPPAPPQRERTPMLMGLAMVIGALCVIAASLLFRWLIPPTKPVFPTDVATAPGTVIMENPPLVLREPAEKPAAQAPTEQPSETAADSTPTVEITELPTLKPQPQPTDNGETENQSGDASPEDTYKGRGFSITPPAGFNLRREGRRTIWQRDDGAQILVESGKAGDGSLRAGWEKLSRDLQKRYGARYHSLGIREGSLDGKPAAIWEFELTGKDGTTRRKIDIGIKHEGRGYAILGSAPKDKFDAALPEINRALKSFRVAPQSQTVPQSTPIAPTAEATSTVPLPEPTGEQTPSSAEAPSVVPTARPTALPMPTATPFKERGY